MSDIAGVHPYADKFPMRDSDLAVVRESIAMSGQRKPIDVTPDGLILDGRTRYKACVELGIEPIVEVYHGDDYAEFVIDANAKRRATRTAESVAPRENGAK